MADFKLMVKKNVEYKKHPRIVGVLKKSIKVIMITKQILDLRVNFSINKLLAYILIIKK